MAELKPDPASTLPLQTPALPPPAADELVSLPPQSQLPSSPKESLTVDLQTPALPPPAADELVSLPPQSQLPSSPKESLTVDSVSVSTQPELVNPVPAPAPARADVPGQVMHKNRLQEFTQRSSIQLPVYQTINEGSTHAPMFRSTVWVDGEKFTSPNVFSHLKAAEQDAAKLALECITRRIREQGCQLKFEDKVFCKSILIEFAIKMGLGKPTYTSNKEQIGPCTTFVSSLVFNGVTYTGEAAATKKEAEQLAAFAGICSLLDNSGAATTLSEIISAKRRLLDQYKKARCMTQAHRVEPVEENTGRVSEYLTCEKKEVEVAVTCNNAAGSEISPGASGMHPQHHEFKMLEPQPPSKAINFPITFVHPVSEQPLDIGSISNKRRRVED